MERCPQPVLRTAHDGCQLQMAHGPQVKNYRPAFSSSADRAERQYRHWRASYCGEMNGKIREFLSERVGHTRTGKTSCCGDAASKERGKPPFRRLQPFVMRKRDTELKPALAGCLTSAEQAASPSKRKAHFKSDVRTSCLTSELEGMRPDRPSLVRPAGDPSIPTTPMPAQMLGKTVAQRLARLLFRRWLHAG